MVFFVCATCNDSLKKCQVERHLLQCRGAYTFACVDCNVNFNRVTYKSHIKCVTEAERYGGSDYKPKPNAEKGAKKQDMWASSFADACNNYSGGDAGIRNILQKLKGESNIPKREARFMNYAINKLSRNVDTRTIQKVWNEICVPLLEAEKAARAINDTDKPVKNEQNSQLEESQSAMETTVEEPCNGKNGHSDVSVKKSFNVKKFVVREVKAAGGEMKLRKLEKKARVKFFALAPEDSEELFQSKWQKALRKVVVKGNNVHL